MMKEKLVSLFLALVMCLGLCVPAFAADTSSPSPEEIPSTVTGILTIEDGTQYPITGRLVATAQPASLSDDISMTYQYNLPADPRAGGSKTEHGVDGGYASTVYLTITYSSNTSGPLPAYLLTRVSGYWSISDSKASVESAYLSYGCTGKDPTDMISHDQHVWDKSVNNHFSVSTGFRYYVEDGLGGAVGANLTVNYLMGTARRWSFTLYNNLFNNL